jgi:hypothetical protein
MNNHGHGEMHMMATPLWECIGFGGFHIDFALVLLAVQPAQKKKII